MSLELWHRYFFPEPVAHSSHTNPPSKQKELSVVRVDGQAAPVSFSEYASLFRFIHMCLKCH